MTGIIAWRNVWRNRKRSIVVISAVALGIWALVFTVAFMNGFVTGYLDNAISAQYSHIQLHHPSFMVNREAQYAIGNSDAISRKLDTTVGIQAITERTLIAGMVASSKTAVGVSLVGIIPEREAAVTRLDSILTEGTYFTTSTRNPILISTKLAEKLGVKTRSKIVVTFQNSTGDITSVAFRIVGIFRSKSPAVNEGMVYVRASDLNALLLNATPAVHEIAVVLKNPQELSSSLQHIRTIAPALQVESWRELAPELDLMVEQSSINQYVLLGIIMIALVFSIVNTMLMAVLERVRELGMLMAIGMNKAKVFAMMVVETLLLSVIGAPFGLLLGYGSVAYLSHTGLDLSAYSEGLASWGYSNVIYPSIATTSYAIFAIGVLCTTLLGALYPAFKAIRLKPVEAIRKL